MGKYGERIKHWEGQLEQAQWPSPNDNDPKCKEARQKRIEGCKRKIAYYKAREAVDVMPDTSDPKNKPIRAADTPTKKKGGDK